MAHQRQKRNQILQSLYFQGVHQTHCDQTEKAFFESWWIENILSKRGNPYTFIQKRSAFSCYRFKNCVAQLSTLQSFLQRPVVIIKTSQLFGIFLTYLFNTVLYLQYIRTRVSREALEKIQRVIKISFYHRITQVNFLRGISISPSQDDIYLSG